MATAAEAAVTASVSRSSGEAVAAETSNTQPWEWTETVTSSAWDNIINTNSFRDAALVAASKGNSGSKKQCAMV
jgi:hypothetical protein